MHNIQEADYRTDWSAYALDDESENRFLSLDHEDLIKICDCIDTRSKDTPEIAGCVPIHYDAGKGLLYVLREGPHTRVCGESGSKKSRTVCRGSVITGALARHSMIITDPKGEIYADPKIRWQLEQQGYDIRALDFRNFDKDGYNILGYAFDKMKKGQVRESDTYLDRFTGMLKQANACSSTDPFWNNNASDLITSSSLILRDSLIQQPDGDQRFHLGSVLSFIRQDKDSVRFTFSSLVRKIGSSQTMNPICQYNDIVNSAAEKTYSSIVASANALLAPFRSSPALLKMLSIQTFDVEDLYQKPTALFLIIPDETATYNAITGYLIDIFYQILIEEYSSRYQSKGRPACPVDFICDECASVVIQDMASKISAGRSREINFVLIYQSERQMEQAYKDFATICGNTKNYIFLGSSDYQILKNVSVQTGCSTFTADGSQTPMVTVEDLRRMQKQLTCKDALVITGNYLLCVRLPDYDVFQFLKKARIKNEPGVLTCRELKIYTPEDVASDYRNGIIELLDADSSSKKRDSKKSSHETIDDVFGIFFDED